MIKIGILGGMSYQSTIHYYEQINSIVNKALGGNITPDLILTSGNFQEIEDLMNDNNWLKIEKILIEKANGMKSMGIEMLVIATNTIHKVANEIEKNTNIPIIHIADSVAQVVCNNNIKKIGLLGTKTTMTEPFIIDRLEKFGLEVFVPDKGEIIDKINEIIFKELCIGEIKKESKDYFLKIINYLKQKYNIEGVILGCTEIQMLINNEDTSMPLFDTTQSHINTISKLIIDNYLKN